MVAADQQSTSDWWHDDRRRFSLLVSPRVLAEAGSGDSDAAARRLTAPQGIAVLDLTDEARDLGGTLPRKPAHSRQSIGFPEPFICRIVDAQEARKAGERVKTAFKRLRDPGIVNENGELLSQELPPDMRPGAERDFGGFRPPLEINCLQAHMNLTVEIPDDLVSQLSATGADLSRRARHSLSRNIRAGTSARPVCAACWALHHSTISTGFLRPMTSG
jgi:hypothetical protein